MNGRPFDDLVSEDYSQYTEDLDNGIESIYDGSFEGEAEFGEYGSGEAAFSPYQRALAARRRQELLRRRQATLNRSRGASPYRPAAPYPPSPAAQINRGLQQTQVGLEKVDIDNKVQADIFTNALRSQRERISRNEYAVATAAVASQLTAQFPDFFKGTLGSLLPLASLLLLKPERKGSGVEAIIKDPRVWAPALAIGFKIFNESSLRGLNFHAKDMRLIKGQSSDVIILDRSNNLIPSTDIVSLTPTITGPVTIKGGRVEASAPGQTYITVEFKSGGKVFKEVFEVNVAAV